MGPEAKLEKKVREAVQAAGGVFLKQTGTPGIPDRLVILPEYEIDCSGQSMGKSEALTDRLRIRPRFVFVEMKAKNGRLSAIQKLRIEQLEGIGCDVRVVQGEEETKAFCEELMAMGEGRWWK